MEQITERDIKIIFSKIFIKNTKLYNFVKNLEIAVDNKNFIIKIIFKKYIDEEIFLKNCLNLCKNKLIEKNINYKIDFSEFKYKKNIDLEENKNINNPIIISDNDFNIKNFIEFYIPGDKNFKNFIKTEFNFNSLELIKKTLNFFLTSKFNNLKNVFLYSRSGLGKSHLLFATYNYLKSKNKNVFYLNLAFLTHDIPNISNNLNLLLNHLNQYDFLLIDDFQFLEKNKELNNFIFLLIDTYLIKNKYIVIVSDSPFKSLTKIENRIFSRLESFINITIDHPTPETIYKIIKNKISFNFSNFKIEKGVIEYLCSNFYENIREIDGIITIIIFNTISLNDNFISLEFIKNILDNKIKENKKNEYIFVIEEVSKFLNISEDSIFNKKNNKKINFSNNLIFYILFNVFNYSYENINSFFNNKKILTIKNGINKVSKLINSDKDLQIFIDFFKYKYYKKYKNIL